MEIETTLAVYAITVQLSYSSRMILHILLWIYAKINWAHSCGMYKLPCGYNNILKLCTC